GGRIKADVPLDPFWKRRLQVGHLGQQPAVQVEGVRVGGLKDGKEHGVATVEPHADVLVARPQLDAADVFDADDPPLAPRFYHDILELFDVVEAPQSAQGDLRRLT